MEPANLIILLSWAWIIAVIGGSIWYRKRSGKPIITRAPVARIVPIEGAPRRLSPEQEAALARTRARMALGWPIAAGPLDRDAIHER